jgi:adenosylmethionine-8-amino-7-oxononanoate aminotransferase
MQLRPSTQHANSHPPKRTPPPAQSCRRRGIPVIFDEVFTGCWRLGAPTAASILGERPDIACYAKLLTAGAAPLAVTVTSEEVFRSFEGTSKVGFAVWGRGNVWLCSAALSGRGQE